MVTFVGTEGDFLKVVKSLVELEYDALAAYQLAVKKLTNLAFKSKMREFLSDHERHIKEIKAHYSGKLDLADSPELIKGTMTRMKVVVADALGSDNTILKAMLDNEKDTNTAYERVVNHPGFPSLVNDFFDKAYQDEIKHKKWLEKHIE